MRELIWSDEAEPYLKIQCGKISDIFSKKTYMQYINAQFDKIWPFLPDRDCSILNIGGGMGGLDMLIVKAFEENGFLCDVLIVDGTLDLPVEPSRKWAGKTFNNAQIGGRWHNKNGVAERIRYLSPFGFKYPIDKHLFMLDCVISLAAWCFHFPPGHYLSHVNGFLKKGGLLIVDVRKERAWLKEVMGSGYRHVALLENDAKRQIVVLERTKDGT